MQDGIPIFILVDLKNWFFFTTFEMKYFIIFSALSKSAITPSRNGLMAVMFPGVLYNIRFASAPTATTRLVPFSFATTDGSLMTIPSPRT